MRQMLIIAGGVLIALLVFALIWNGPAVMEKVSGVLTGWDDQAKASFAKERKCASSDLTDKERIDCAVWEADRYNKASDSERR